MGNELLTGFLAGQSDNNSNGNNGGALNHVVQVLLPFPAGFSAVSLAGVFPAASSFRRALTSCLSRSSSSSGPREN